MMKRFLTRTRHYFFAHHSINFRWRISHFRLSTISSQLSTGSESLLRCALSQELCDVEVYKIGVMKND